MGDAIKTFDSKFSKTGQRGFKYPNVELGRVNNKAGGSSHYSGRNQRQGKKNAFTGITAGSTAMTAMASTHFSPSRNAGNSISANVSQFHSTS